MIILDEVGYAAVRKMNVKKKQGESVRIGVGVGGRRGQARERKEGEKEGKGDEGGSEQEMGRTISLS